MKLKGSFCNKCKIFKNIYLAHRAQILIWKLALSSGCLLYYKDREKKNELSKYRCENE